MKLGGIALVGALSFCAPQVVLAADYSAAPAPYNWSGAYVGAVAGYGWSQTTTGDTSFYDDPDGVDLAGGIPGFGYSGSGLIGGGEAGYNWQSGNFVLGVVGDVSAANIRGTYTDTVNAFSVDSTINWLSTARVNLGVPLGKALIYATGGLAYGQVTDGLHDSYDAGATVIDSTATTHNLGWALGGGVAAAVSPNWIFKAEYLFVDLGSKNVSFSEPDPGWPLITSSGKTTASLVRASLDYKF